jgi:hypothetical protein
MSTEQLQRLVAGGLSHSRREQRPQAVPAVQAPNAEVD